MLMWIALSEDSHARKPIQPLIPLGLEKTGIDFMYLRHAVWVCDCDFSGRNSNDRAITAMEPIYIIDAISADDGELQWKCG